MRRAKGRFEEAGVQVVIVGMGSEVETEAFKRKFDVPYPMVCDPEKRIYQAFDIGRMSLLEALKPGIALRGVTAMAKGHGIGLPQGDVRQLPGVFVIGRDGKILYSHYARDAADHPSPQEILGHL